MTILDTNVVSELLADSPSPIVLEWFDSVDRVGSTAVTVMEFRHGSSRLPPGRRRDQLIEKFEQFIRLVTQDIFVFDVPAAEEAGEYLAMRERIGHPLVDHRDAMIAGVVLNLVNRHAMPARLATRNVRHFLHVPVVNPWEASRR